MAIESTNMARLCTDKWQRLWVKLDAHKYCQIFVSPYTWDYLYFYNNERHEVWDKDMWYYDKTTWVKVTDEKLKLQYSNKVREFQTTPATQYTVTLQTNGFWGSLTLNWEPIEDPTDITVPWWTSITVANDTLTIWNNVIVAVPDEWYEFEFWWDENWSPLPARVTGDMVAMAEFMDGDHGYLFEWEDHDEDTPNVLTTVLEPWSWEWWIWAVITNAFKTYTGLADVTVWEIITAEDIQETSLNITFSESEEPDAEYPYYCTAEYTQEIGDREEYSRIATVSIVDTSWPEIVDLATLIINQGAGA